MEKELLKKLAISNDNTFLEKHIRNGSVEEREVIATNIYLNEENFKLLAFDEDFGVRLKLIGNKHVPGYILAKIPTKIII